LSARRDAETLAQEVSRHMLANDPMTRWMGIELMRAGPGEAQLAMTVTPNMLNSQSVCHGGMMFALADSAFAYACNARNHATVASGCAIDFLLPAVAGDRLTATAVERALGGRTGVYDITLRNQRDETVALFRGKSYRLKAQVLPNRAPE